MRAITRRTIIENVLTLIAGSAFGQIALSIVLFLVVRTLGPGGAGQYIACFALAKLTSVIFELGMDSLVLKEGGAQPGRLGELVLSNLTIKTLLGAIWFIGLLVLRNFLDENTYPRDLFFVAIVVTWLESASLTFLTGFKSTLSNRITALISFSSSLVLVGATIYLLIREVNSPLPYALIRLIVVAVFLIFSGLWFSRMHKMSSSRVALSEMIRDTRPFFSSAALATIYSQASITIVAIYLGESATGIYGTAAKVINFLFVVPLSIYSVMVPVLSSLITVEDERLERIISRLLYGMTVLGALMWASTALLGKPLVEIFLGNEFLGVGELLFLLSGVLFVKAGSFASASILVAVGWQDKRAVVQALVTIVNIILNISLVQNLGIDGAALAFLISETLLMLGYTLVTFQWKRIRHSLG